jgi:hypothetical protein
MRAPGREPSKARAGDELRLRLHNAGDLHAVLTDLRVVIDARVSYARVALGVHVQGPERFPLQRKRKNAQPQPGEAGLSVGERKPQRVSPVSARRAAVAAHACAMRWMAHERHRASRAQPTDRPRRACSRGALLARMPVDRQAGPGPSSMLLLCACVRAARMRCLGSTWAASSVSNPNMMCRRLVFATLYWERTRKIHVQKRARSLFVGPCHSLRQARDEPLVSKLSPVRDAGASRLFGLKAGLSCA